jgi:tetratricopeptide (TPR) repeat protein
LLERALQISENALGLDHPSVATDLNNLGGLLQDLGDYDNARSLMERALSICEAALESGHPNTMIVNNNLASLLAEMEDHS